MKRKICSKCGREMSGKFCESCGGKSKNKSLLLIVIIIFAIIIIGSFSDNQKEDKDKKVVNKVDAGEKLEKEDLSSISKEYELASRYYTAGIDLPIGVCNIMAISGVGNVSSSNMFSGGLNEMMGIGDPDMYETDFKGLKMPKNVSLSVSNGVVIKLNYTSLTAGFSGREYDESKAIELSSGNYTAGTDFSAGTYNISVVNGSGNVSSSNMFSGGINAIMGIDDTSIYEKEYKNVKLDKDVELSVSGVTIRLTPQK